MSDIVSEIGSAVEAVATIAAPELAVPIGAAVTVASDVASLVTPATPATADTVASVQAATLATVAGDAGALAAAVNNSLAKSAPSNEFEAAIQAIHARLSSLETTLGTIAPVVSDVITAASPLVSAAVPAAAPVLARLPAIESTIGSILSAFNAHFGAGKIAGLPTAPATAKS